ncbi:MAG: polysaccharide biosynthesis protein, partial [Janthinobacterium sp.]
MKSFLDLSRFHKQIIAASADLLMLPLIFSTAILLRYDVVDMVILKQYYWLILLVPVVSLPVFVRRGVYRAVIPVIDQNIVYVVILGVSI